jgi:hypothetical protein
MDLLQRISNKEVRESKAREKNVEALREQQNNKEVEELVMFGNRIMSLF